jgi:hypothetical protein
MLICETAPLIVIEYNEHCGSESNYSSGRLTSLAASEVRALLDGLVSEEMFVTPCLSDS